ncbi:polysaccharide biosynthesis tyrosine autokinase [Geodermatophilus sp. SYSU D00758]
MLRLNDVLRAIRTRWWAVLGGTVAGLAVAGALSAAAEPTYESSTRLLVSVAGPPDAPSAYQGSLFTRERIDSYAELLTTSQLAQQVVEDLGSPSLTAEQVAGTVTATPLPNTDILSVTVTDTSAARAQAIATSLGRQFTETVAELETPDDAQAPLVEVRTVEPATYEPAPVSPDVPRNLALGTALGFLAGLGLALLRDRLDPHVRSTRDARDATGASPVFRLPEDRQLSRSPLVDRLDPSSPTATAVQTVGLGLQHGSTAVAKVVVVSSAVPGEGKSTVAAALAGSLARSGRSVLLVDGNLWRPRLARYLGIEDGGPGLSDVLAGRAEVSDATRVLEDRFHVLLAGSMPEAPGAALASAGTRDLLDAMREYYDHVLIDAPALLPVVDAAALSASSDGCLVITRYGRTTRDELAEAATTLAAVGAQVLGVVVNRVPGKRAAHRRRGGYTADPDRGVGDPHGSSVDRASPTTGSPDPRGLHAGSVARYRRTPRTT